MHVRVFLAKYQKPIPCLYCHGKRFRKETLGVKFAGKTIFDFSTSRVSELLKTLRAVKLSEEEEKRAGFVFRQICGRLEYLERVGLGYLSLDRQIKTLSVGEIRRVDLTKALASDLVDMLYVLDEPSTGLHPSETERLAKTLLELRDRGNTVVVTDNSPALLGVADNIVEFGVEPGVGGTVMFQGTAKELLENKDSLTGEFLTGRRSGVSSRRRDVKNCDLLELTGARGRNLKNVSLAIPLGTFCLATGVSGAGKRSLVCDTLFPALARKISVGTTQNVEPLPFDALSGYENLEEVKFINQEPIGRSPRSNPATICAFSTKFARSTPTRRTRRGRDSSPRTSALTSRADAARPAAAKDTCRRI